MGDRQNDSIRITCSPADFLPLDAIEEFQGNLKKRSQQEIHKIITSILRYGFSFPFFIWRDGARNRCLDGHGRLLALSEMRKRHYFIFWIFRRLSLFFGISFFAKRKSFLLQVFSLGFLGEENGKKTVMKTGKKKWAECAIQT